MMTPIRKCLHSQLARFLGDRRGNVAILTALLATPALAITGAAVDFSRALSAKSELSMALDSALLSLASKPQMEDQNAVEFVTDYVNDTLAANAKNIDWAVSQFVQTPQSVEASLNATVATSVLGILNLSELKVHLTSQVTRENKKVEVALVLDNTGSMGSNGKIGRCARQRTACSTSFSPAPTRRRWSRSRWCPSSPRSISRPTISIRRGSTPRARPTTTASTSAPRPVIPSSMTPWA